MIKTILAIILFGLAFKASGALTAKRPDEVPVLPDEAITDEDKQLEKAQRSAADFLQGAEAYIDTRPMARMQHKAMVTQREILSSSQPEESAAPTPENDLAES